MKDCPHGEAMAEQFQANPAYAAKFMIEVRNNDGSAELVILLDKWQGVRAE